MSERDGIEAIRDAPDRPLSHAHMRLDLRRDTRMSVVPNIDRHVHITLGRDQATLIIHPHAARRLIANIQQVLDGKDFACD